MQSNKGWNIDTLSLTWCSFSPQFIWLIIFLFFVFADPWQDLEDSGGKAGYKKLTDFKKTHKHLKVLLAIGGWNEGSQNYSELAGHPDRRQRFVKQSSEFIRKYNFDGKYCDSSCELMFNWLMFTSVSAFQYILKCLNVWVIKATAGISSFVS